MKLTGLQSWKNWRTLLVGFFCGYIFAWSIHRATYVWSWNKGWIEERIPILVPEWSRPD